MSKKCMRQPYFNGSAPGPRDSGGASISNLPAKTPCILWALKPKRTICGRSVRPRKTSLEPGCNTRGRSLLRNTDNPARLSQAALSSPVR